VLFTRIDIRRTRFDSRPEIDDMNEVCFRRLRLFPPRFRDLARPQNRLNNVNTVCFRRLQLFLLIPGSCDLTIDDVNKFCFRRLRFLPRFWEPGETAGIGPRLPGVIAGGNVGGRGRVLQENVLAGVRISKEGKSGIYYVPLLWEGYNFLHTRRVSVWMKFWEESTCPLGKRGTYKL